MIRSLAILLVMLASTATARDRTMPDPEFTPGVARELSLEEICTTKWGRDHRSVTPAMRRHTREHYADVVKHCRGKRGIEIDHLIPRCAGGADVEPNLSAQCYSGRWNAVMKDRFEVKVCKLICDHYPDAGTLSVVEALEKFRDWQAGYIEYYGNPYGGRP